MRRRAFRAGLWSARTGGAAADRPKTSSGKKAPQECPCGFFNDARRECFCSPVQISRYLAKISGPLLDRIDLQIEVPALSAEEITSCAPGEPSSAIRGRVQAARQIQRDRFRRSGAQSNAEMSSRQLRRWCELDPLSRRLIEQAIAHLGLSARAYDRVLKVARTIADLAGTEHLDSAHVAEAVHYRALDRGYFRSAA